MAYELWEVVPTFMLCFHRHKHAPLYLSKCVGTYVFRSSHVKLRRDTELTVNGLRVSIIVVFASNPNSLRRKLPGEMYFNGNKKYKI